MNLRMLLLWFPLLLPAYLLRFKIGPLPTTALEIVLLALVIIVTVRDRSIWTEGWKKTAPWRWPALAWIIASLIAVVVAPDHVAALGLWRAYIAEPLIYFVLLLGALRTDSDRTQVIRALIASSVFVSTWALIQFVTNIGIPHPWDTASWLTRRATGPFPYPNALALFSAPIAALCGGLLIDRAGRDESRPYRAWLIIGLISAFAGAVLAKSAGGIGAILACLLIAGLWKKSTRAWTAIIGIIVVTVAVVTPQIRTPLVTLVTFKGWSGTVRTIMWKETVAMLKDHPVFGAGFGAYPTVFAKYHTAKGIEIFQYPHDILLNLWSETGILGVLAFIWICVTWVRLAIRRSAGQGGYKTRPYVVAAILPLFAMLVHGLVDVPYFKNDLAMLFWVFAALAGTCASAQKMVSSHQNVR